MKCMYCGHLESKVIDSRSTEDGLSIRRRRECLSCGKRFTTYESIETTPIIVVKNDGSRQVFDVNKLKTGIIKACEKRPVAMQEIDDLVEQIRRQLSNSLEQEVTSQMIGECVMNGLKEIDEVAYVRFASVYRKFKDIPTFLAEIESMIKK